MKSKFLGFLLVAASGVALTSCNTNDGKDSTWVRPEPDTTHREVAKRTAYDGTEEAVWATEDAAHISEEIKGEYDSGDSGVYFAGISSADKASVLGDIESWAKSNYLLGIPLFGDGGWTLLSSRVQSPLANKTYVTGYGFGIVREGKLTSDLTETQEPNAEYRSYIHYGLNEAEAEINPYDSNNSGASSLLSLMDGSLYNQRLVKDGEGGYEAEYEWYDSLAIGEPEPLDFDEETQTATKWKVKVKTGKNSNLKFKTLSTKSISGTSISSFNDKEVTVDDYIWGYRVALNGNNKYSYASQYAARFAGANDYYANSTDAVVGSEEDDALWEKVGIKKLDDEHIELDMKTAYTATNFKVYSSLDICNEEFWKLVTGYGTDSYKPTQYGTGNSDGTLTPADTILSCGPYTLKTFATGTGTDNEIVFVRNDEWVDKVAEDNDNYTIYQIPGIVYKINSAYGGENGTETKYQAWLNGNIDEANVPTARKNEYTVESPNIYVTANASITSLQVNSCTEARWQEVYGEHGTNWDNQGDYSYDESKASQYTIKPVMSNYDFLDGIYFSIDRATLADSLMVGRSSDWVGEEYLVDIDSGVSYDDTAAHKSAVKDWLPDTYGYSTSVAQAKFESAMDTLVSEGKYTAGTASNPTVITINLQVAANSQKTNWANTVKNYIETSFNTEAMLNKGFKLEVNLPDAPAQVLDIYGILASGCYDLCWGGISGGTADTLSLFGCWLDDWCYGLQMSVGANPNQDNGTIHYNGYTFSAAGIWYAIEWGEPVLITNGVFVGYPNSEDDTTTAN